MGGRPGDSGGGSRTVRRIDRPRRLRRPRPMAGARRDRCAGGDVRSRGRRSSGGWGLLHPVRAGRADARPGPRARESPVGAGPVLRGGALPRRGRAPSRRRRRHPGRGGRRRARRRPDPVAIAIARLRLQVLAPGSEPDVRVGDGLGEHPGAPYDVVVGNPPFHGRLRSRLRAVDRRAAPPPPQPPGSAPTPTPARSSSTARSTWWVLAGASRWCSRCRCWPRATRRGCGRPSRRRVRSPTSGQPASRCSPGTSVLTCVPVLAVGATQGPIVSWHGPHFDAGAADRAARRRVGTARRSRGRHPHRRAARSRHRRRPRPLHRRLPRPVLRPRALRPRGRGRRLRRR